MKIDLAKQSNLTAKSIASMSMMFILLLAFGLGVRGLNADIIWSDELFSLAFMGAFDPPYSPAQIIATLQVHAPDHVPLYYFFGSIWGQMADWHQLAMRFISLAAGVLMVAWLYRFASDVVNLRAGVIAAMLMTTSAFVVVYFHELRVYTFLMMLSIMHCWALLAACLRRFANQKNLAALCFDDRSLALHAQFFADIVCGFGNQPFDLRDSVSALATDHRRLGRWRIAVCALCSGAAGWIIYFRLQRARGVYRRCGAGASSSAGERIRTLLAADHSMFRIRAMATSE